MTQNVTRPFSSFYFTTTYKAVMITLTFLAHCNSFNSAIMENCTSAPWHLWRTVTPLSQQLWRNATPPSQKFLRTATPLGQHLRKTATPLRQHLRKTSLTLHYTTLYSTVYYYWEELLQLAKFLFLL